MSTQDPHSLRVNSLELCPDASFRIQYHSSEESLYFSFLPKEIELLTAPRPYSSSDAACYVENPDTPGACLMGEEDINMIFEEKEGKYGIADNGDGQPQAKRIKTK